MRNLRPLTSALAFALVAFISFVAAPLSVQGSVKERGGGSATQTGELADLEFVRSSRPMKNEVEGLLESPLEELLPLVPEFAALLFPEGLDDTETRYYLSPHEIKVSDCELKSPLQVQSQIAACNIKINAKLSEVFIAESYWKQATASRKLHLIIHEQLRSHQLRIGAETDIPLFRLTTAVVNFIELTRKPDSTLGEKEFEAQEILRLSLEGRFGSFSMGLTQHVLLDAATDAFKDFCRGQTQTWPTEMIEKAGAPLFANLIDSTLSRQAFVENRSAACNSLKVEIANAISSYRGRIDTLYPIYWR